MSAIAVLCGGLPLSAALAGGLAAPPVLVLAPVLANAAAVPAAAVALTGAGAPGSLQACAAYAYAAIERHTVVTATPPECRGLSRAAVNQAAAIAIRRAAAGGVKSAERKEAGAAARWVSAMITGPAPAPAQTAPAPAARPPAGGGRAGEQAGGLGLGGVSELAAKIGALLAWLATAGSGGYVLVRWLLAGGSALRRTTTAAPPAVILAHVGAGALGLLLWVCFLLSGWTALAWTALAILAPVAGLGMGLLLLGLPSPARPPIGALATKARATKARAPGRRTRIPVAAVVGHGMFAVTALLLVLMATIGAG